MRTYATLTNGLLTTAERFTPSTQHAHVHGEQFTGNGVQTQFTLANTPLYGVSTFVAGVRQDVTLNGAVVTFAVAPLLNALIRINYEYLP